MPPKKKEEPVEKPVLGRFKSNLKVQSIAVGLLGTVAVACTPVNILLASSLVFCK